MDVAMFNMIAGINDHLFLSSARAIKTDRIRTLGITHIINATVEVPNTKILGVECIQIYVEDMPHARLGIYFDRAADKIHEIHKKGGKTLVHCVAGISRSASLCIAYLMKYEKMSLNRAYYHCKNRRSYVHPNVGFWQQLIDYEKRLFGRTTVKMVASGVGPIPDVYKGEARTMMRYPTRSLSHHSPARSENRYSTTYSRSYSTLSPRRSYLSYLT